MTVTRPELDDAKEQLRRLREHIYRRQTLDSVRVEWALEALDKFVEKAAK